MQCRLTANSGLTANSRRTGLTGYPAEDELPVVILVILVPLSKGKAFKSGALYEMENW